MVGRQTVPRAEVFVLIAFLKFLLTLASEIRIIITSLYRVRVSAYMKGLSLDRNQGMGNLGPMGDNLGTTK